MPSRRSVLAGLAASLAAPALAGCGSLFEDDPAGTTRIPTGATTFQAIVRGPTTAEAKKVVLFLHGGAYTSRVWSARGILDDVVHEGYRVVAVDLPGSGGTRMPDEDVEHGGPTDAEILRQLVDAVGGQDRVVVVSPSASGRYSLPFLAASNPVNHLAGFVPVAPVGIVDFRRPWMAPKVPTLIVWGANDDEIPLEQGRVLRALLPGSELQVIPDAGHAAYDDDPDAFTALLLRFLASLPT